MTRSSALSPKLSADHAWELELLSGEEERLPLRLHCQTHSSAASGVEHREWREDRCEAGALWLLLR